MGGIAGLWNLDGRPVDRHVFSRMVDAIRHRGPDGSGQHVTGPAALCAQHFWITPEEIGEQQPLVGPRGVMLAFDGRLDNREELLPALQLPRATSDAACALAAYERWGEQFPERLNGDFAVAAFDGAGNRLVLARDAIGVRPLYYVLTPRLFAFASEIKALLAHPGVPAEPDDEGIADYLLLSARPVDRQHLTCFAGISSLVPAHLAVVTPERMAVRRYWDFDPSRSIRLRTFDEYVDGFRACFSQAVSRRTRSAHPVAVSLSGGLDSSSIYCQAEVLRRKSAGNCPGLLGVSYYGEKGTDADESAFVTDVEGMYGAVERFDITPFVGLVDGADDQIRAVEAPFFDYMWGVTRELHRRATGRGARVLLTGTWGDQVMFSCGYLVDLARARSWREICRHLREYPQWIGGRSTRVLIQRFGVDLVRHHLPSALLPPLKHLRRTLTPSTRPRWFSDDFLRRALRFANHPVGLGKGFHSVQARSLYLEARSKYHVHCLEWTDKIAASRGMRVALPFLDRDLVAFMMAIPGQVQNWNGVPRGLLREALTGVLPEPVRQRTWKADFSEFVNTGVERDTAVVGAALSAGSLAVRFGYLDARRLAPEVARLSATTARGGCAASWSLADAFGLEVWLRVFCGDGAGSPRTPATQAAC